MIASLPMYRTPVTAAAHDRLWALIRDHLHQDGLSAPDRLCQPRGDLLVHWHDPALLLSQTCGLPYRARLRGQVVIVGTPDYGLPDCPPGHYRSVVVTRVDDAARDLADLSGAAFAYNDPLSQSGWASLALTAPEVLTGPKHCTGSHRAAAAAVGQGTARFAAIDAQTWRQLEAGGETAGLRVIHRTAPVAGLPLITAQADLVGPLRQAVSAAIAELSRADRDVLCLQSLQVLPEDAYDLPIPPMPDGIGS